ncbi:MAG: hypothetical protein EXS25_01995 [Pedosphaera sp.]|nr:hypothetical protein [Pedosphaera sp.]
MISSFRSVWTFAVVLLLALPLPSKGDITREELFDGPLLHWDIQLTRAAIEKLRGASGFRSEGQRPEVSCHIRAGTNFWTDVALHIKGAAGSSRRFDDTPAFTLNFGKLHEGQTCLGHRKLHLNNSVQDAGRMDELLASEMYLQSGVPTPRATHAIVSVNGRRLGVYVLKGGWDKAFLKSHFGSSKGNLYDGGFLQDIDSNLQRDSGEGEPDWSDLITLRKANNLDSSSARLIALGKCLDIDRFITLTALQILLDDWDGYVRNHNNYRIYTDPSSTRSVFMPHGMDQLWRSPQNNFSPRFSSQIASRLFSIPEMATQLSARMKNLTNSVFNAGFVDTVFEKAQERLFKALKAERRLESDEPYLRQAMNDTRSRIAVRMATFEGSSYVPPVPVNFDASGYARLTQWRRSVDGRPAKLDFGSLANGKKSLKIQTLNEGSTASWRSQASLPRGRYRFEARARTQGVTGANDFGRGSGAGLRISGIQRENGLQGTHVWTSLSFEFEVGSGKTGQDETEPANQDNNSQEVSLVAELRADSGEVEFDLESLKLKRL